MSKVLGGGLMRYCDFCVMPDSRPGIKFTTLSDGRLKCSACINHENKQKIDIKPDLKNLKLYAISIEAETAQMIMIALLL